MVWTNRAAWRVWATDVAERKGIARGVRIATSSHITSSQNFHPN